MNATSSDQGPSVPADIEALRRELEAMAKLKRDPRPKAEPVGSVLILKGK